MNKEKVKLILYNIKNVFKVSLLNLKTNTIILNKVDVSSVINNYHDPLECCFALEEIFNERNYCVRQVEYLKI